MPVITDIREEIAELKQRENATILAHYYQEGEIQELADFTGLGDDHDDQVDALSAAYYPLQKAANLRLVQDETHFHFG